MSRLETTPKNDCEIVKQYTDTETVLSTLPDNSGDAMNEISRIITEVCHFFSRLDFPTIKFQLFCVVYAILMLTSNVSSSTPVCHCNIIIWLVFAHFVSSQIIFMTIGVNEYFLHKWCHDPCIMTSCIIPCLSVLNI